MTKLELDHALKAGIEFLASQQRPDGGFDGFVSPAPGINVQVQQRPTIFFTALVTQCCAGLPKAESITGSATQYLLRHKSKNWSWNYWQRDNAGKQMLGYPDDLDDTACALAAITACDPSLVDGAVLGFIGQQLVAAESHPGGPYQTWLVPSAHLDTWHDVDLAVNANIAYMLAQINVMPPGLERYLCRALKTNQIHSNYYPGKIHLLYLIARSNIPATRGLLRRRLTMELKKSPATRSSLVNALLLSTVCRLGYSKRMLQGLAEAICNSQQNGHWPAEAFYIESCFGGIASYAGSSALTTAFACEALGLYQALAADPSAAPTRVPQRTASSIKAFQAGKRLSNTIPGNELRTDYQRALRMVRRQDSDGQISGLPIRLGKDIGAALPSSQLRHLQLASINGWMAYTLYDNILDAQDPAARLCTANLALRMCVEEFRQAVPISREFQQLVQQTLNTVDGANAWESAQARAIFVDSQLAITSLPNYANLSQLAERSWGHVLASCAVLTTHGLAINSTELQRWLRFFHHFLIARQLNDDAHDWQEDISRGQLSAVVCMLLEDSAFPLRLDFARAIPELRQRFWQETVTSVCDKISEHITLAEAALKECDFILDKKYYQGLLDYLRSAVEATRASRAEALAFMQSFTGKVEV